MPANPRDIRAGGAFVEIGGVDDKLRAALDGAAKRLRTFAKTVATIGASIQGISLVPLTSLFVLAGLAASAGDNFVNLAAKTGLTVGQVAALGQQAKDAGSSIETVTTAVKKLQTQVTELGRGSSSAIALFRKFGLTATELVGKTPYEQLQAVADAMSRIADPAQRAYLATELLGRSGAELIPILADGSRGLEEAYRRYERLGIIIGAVAAAQVAEFDDIFSEIISQIGALKNVVGAAAAETFLPILKAVQPVLAAVIQFVSENSRLVGQIIVASAATLVLGTAIVGIGVAIYTASLAFSGFSAVVGLAFLPLRALTNAVGLAARAFGSLVSMVGLAGRAIVGLGGGVASLIGGLTSIAGSVLALVSGGVTTGLSAIGTVFGVMASASVAAVTTVISAMTALVSGAATIIGGLVAVLTPLIVSAVGAIASVVGTAIVTAFAFINAVIGASIIVAVGAIAPAVAGIVAAAVFAITQAGGLLLVAAGFAAAAIIHGLLKGLGELGPALARLFDGIVGVFRSIGEFIVSTFTTAYEAAVGVVSSIGTFFAGIGRSIAAGFATVASYIGSAAAAVGSFFASIPTYAQQAFSAMASYGQQVAAFLGGVFSGLGATLGQTFKGAIDALQAGDLALAGEIAFAGLQLAWQRSVLAMKVVWFAAKQEIVNFAIDKYVDIATAFNELLAGMDTMWVKGLAGLRAAWVLFSSAFMGIWDAAINFVEDGLLVVIAKVKGIPLEDLQKQAAGDRAARAKARGEETNRQLADISTGQQQRLDDIRGELRKRNEELRKLKGAIETAPSNAARQSMAATEAEIKRLQAVLDGLTKEADAKNAAAQENQRRPALDPLNLGLDQVIKALGTFNGASIETIFAGGTGPLVDIKRASERTAKATEQTVNALAAIASGYNQPRFK